MAYSDGEALILTRLQAATNFSATNTSRGKWGILNKGKSDHYGIVRPGPFEISPGRGNDSNTWQTVIEVWQRYKEDGTSLTDLEARVANVLTAFRPYRRIGDTANAVVDAAIKSGSEVQQLGAPGEGPSWIRQDLIVTWIEESTYTMAE